jgi:hypothetical protein
MRYIKGDGHVLHVRERNRIQSKLVAVGYIECDLVQSRHFFSTGYVKWEKNEVDMLLCWLLLPSGIFAFSFLWIKETSLYLFDQ